MKLVKNNVFIFLLLAALGLWAAYSYLRDEEPVVIIAEDQPEPITIDEMFQKAIKNEAKIDYILGGDSTHDNGFNKMVAYYTTQLAKINVNLIDNARSGQSGQNWKNNSETPTINEAIEAITGTGVNTIYEFNWGIIDYKDGATIADVKGWLKEGIDILLAAKPNLTILLTTPMFTANTPRNFVLEDIYNELAAEYGLRLVNSMTVMGAVHGNLDYYQDNSHNNESGSRRSVNFLLNELTSYDTAQHITLEEIEFNPPVAGNLAKLEEKDGLWNARHGIFNPIVNWGALKPIPIEPYHQIIISHKGNRFDLSVMDEDGDFAYTGQTVAIPGETYRELVTEPTAKELRLNITSNYTAYKSINDVPSVTYKPPLSIAEINVGLDLQFPLAVKELN